MRNILDEPLLESEFRRRLTKEVAFACIALEEFKRTPSSEYKARAMINFFAHLPEHIAELYEVNVHNKLVFSLAADLNQKLKQKRDVQVSQWFWHILIPAHEGDFNSVSDAFKNWSNATKHGITRKRHAEGYDPSNLTANPDWESEDFWEDTGIVKGKSGKHQPFEPALYIETLKKGVSTLIDLLGLSSEEVLFEIEEELGPSIDGYLERR